MAKWDAALYADRILSRDSRHRMYSAVQLNSGATAPYTIIIMTNVDETHTDVLEVSAAVAALYLPDTAGANGRASIFFGVSFNGVTASGASKLIGCARSSIIHTVCPR